MADIKLEILNWNQRLEINILLNEADQALDLEAKVECLLQAVQMLMKAIAPES